MAHFNQVRSDENILMAVEEDHTGFSLDGRCNDGADGLVLGEDRAVWIWSRPDGGRG